MGRRAADEGREGGGGAQLLLDAGWERAILRTGSSEEEEECISAGAAGPGRVRAWPTGPTCPPSRGTRTRCRTAPRRRRWQVSPRCLPRPRVNKGEPGEPGTTPRTRARGEREHDVGVPHRGGDCTARASTGEPEAGNFAAQCRCNPYPPLPPTTHRRPGRRRSSPSAGRPPVAGWARSSRP